MILSKNKVVSAVFFIVVYFLFSFMYIYQFGTYVPNSILFSRGIYNIEFSFGKCALSFFLFIVTLILYFRTIKNDRYTGANYMLLFLIILGYIPENILFFAGDLPLSYLLLLHCYWWIMIFSIFFIKNRGRNNRKILNLSDKHRSYIFIGLILIFLLLTLLIISFYGGLNFNLTFNIDEIYSLRINAREYNMPKILEYTKLNAMYVILPTIILISIKIRKFIVTFILLVIELMLYNTDNQKAVLFLVIGSILFVFFYKNNIFIKIPKYFSILSLFTIIIFKTKLGTFIIRNIYDRLIFLPAVLGEKYFSYFTNNDKIVPFVSLFKKIGLVNNYKYNDGISYMMGLQLFNNSDISANTGSFGNASSYGVAGIILIPVIYGILFTYLDKVTTNISPKVYIAFVLIQSFVILNVSIFVVVTSYGYILGLFIFYLINNNKSFRLLRNEYD